MFKDYFAKKDYIYFYLMKICYSIASSLLTIFSVVVLYQNGLSITTIIMMECLKFGIMGLFTPFCMVIARRFGIKMVAFSANLCRILTCYILLNNTNTNILLLVFLMGISGALANPLENMITSRYVDIKNSGKCISLKNISKILGTVISSILVTIGIVTNNKGMLFAIIVIFYLLDVVFTSKLDFKPEIKQYKMTNPFKYILNTKDEMKEIYYLRAFLILERNFIPLYIYIVLNNFVNLTIVIVISLVFQLVTLFLIGRLTDKDTKKTFNVVCILKEMVSGIFLLFHIPTIVSTNKLLYDNTDQLYETTRQSITQKYIKKSNENQQMLPSVYEMCLCFSEVIVFSIFAWISKYVHENIFILIFAMAILAVYIINMKLNKIEIKTKELKTENLLQA